MGKAGALLDRLTRDLGILRSDVLRLVWESLPILVPCESFPSFYPASMLLSWMFPWSITPWEALFWASPQKWWVGTTLHPYLQFSSHSCAHSCVGVELDGRCHCDISVPSSNVLCWEEAGGFLKSGIQPALTWSNISRTWVGKQTRKGVPKDGAIWGRPSMERGSLKNLEAREKCWGLENAELRSIHILLAASARP